MRGPARRGGKTRKDVKATRQEGNMKSKRQSISEATVERRRRCVQSVKLLRMTDCFESDLSFTHVYSLTRVLTAKGRHTHRLLKQRHKMGEMQIAV